MTVGFMVDSLDLEDGEKSHHIVCNGQTVAIVDECCFDEPLRALQWARTIASALNTLEVQPPPPPAGCQ